MTLTPCKEGNDGRTILHIACKKANIRLVQALIQVASPLVSDDVGFTPLHECSRRGYTECVKALLQVNAPIMIRDSSGETAIDIATPETKILFDNYIEKNKDRIFRDYDAIQAHAKEQYFTPESITRIFVIGNPGAGKSSLIEAMELNEEGFSLLTQISVPPHTAGIIPSIHTSDGYKGRITLLEIQNITPHMLPSLRTLLARVKVTTYSLI